MTQFGEVLRRMRAPTTYACPRPCGAAVGASIAGRTDRGPIDDCRTTLESRLNSRRLASRLQPTIGRKDGELKQPCWTRQRDDECDLSVAAADAANQRSALNGAILD